MPFNSFSVCLSPSADENQCNAQADANKAEHDKTVAETGAKPMKREAEPLV